MKKLLLTCLASASLYAAQAADITITDADLATGTTYSWTKDNTYFLDGLVYLETGGTLNIEAGTVIKGKSKPAGQDASALIICRGAKINATGTKYAPITFTAELDPLDGSLAGTQNALWGGLIILGQATTSRQGNAEVNIEGIDPNEARAKYGALNGTAKDDDNSGILTYVSVRHCGFTLASGSEINGITLGGVGSGTKIEHIEVYGCSDDGIEIFGGTVGIKWAVVAFAEDDSFDWDEIWTGNGQFWFSIQRADIADAAWESDGSTPDDAAVVSKPKVYNFTAIGSGSAGTAVNPIGILLRAGTEGEIANGIVAEMKGKGLEIQDKPSNTNDSYQKLIDGKLTFKSVTFWQAGTDITSIGADGVVRITANADDAAGTTVLAHLANNNSLVETPGFKGATARVPAATMEAAVMDPTPDAAVAGKNTVVTPTGDFWTAAAYRGAFDPAAEYPWVAKWTALAKAKYLKDFDTTTVGINKIVSPFTAVTVYPNPASGSIQVQYAVTATKTLNVEFVNMNGQVVKAFTNNKIAGNGNLTFNIEGVAAGVYAVRFTDNANGIHTERVVIK